MIYARTHSKNKGPVIRPKKGFSIEDCRLWISQVRKNAILKNQTPISGTQLKLDFE